MPDDWVDRAAADLRRIADRLEQVPRLPRRSDPDDRMHVARVSNKDAIAAGNIVLEAVERGALPDVVGDMPHSDFHPPLAGYGSVVRFTLAEAVAAIPDHPRPDYYRPCQAFFRWRMLAKRPANHHGVQFAFADDLRALADSLVWVRVMNACLAAKAIGKTERTVRRWANDGDKGSRKHPTRNGMFLVDARLVDD